MNLYSNELGLHVSAASSLLKVFPNTEVPDESLREIHALRGEVVRFQILCRAERDSCGVRLESVGDFSKYVRVREEVYVPCLSPAYADDPDVLTHDAGLFPGPLTENNTIELDRNCTHAFFVTVSLPQSLRGGAYEIRFKLRTSNHWTEVDNVELPPVAVRLSNVLLPKQKLSCEMWFHADCILTYYKLKLFSEDYWRILGRYFKNMTEHGVNVLLTPLWTPPLDTGIGTRRPFVQLLGISLSNGKYKFDFRNLKRWIDTAKRAGFRRFSFSHLFTQWGLKATPDITVRRDGKAVRLFGWQTPSDSPEYESFLRQLFPPLLAFLQSQEITPSNAYFHLSDEPEKTALDNYSRYSTLVHSLLGEYRTLDALSEPEFFDLGLVNVPVPATDAVEPFMERKISERWMYYCGNWRDRVPNRKHGMSPVRNRILGVILYKYEMSGFLEWGYNFWNSKLSLRHLNPWDVRELTHIFGNDGGAFAVWPGDDGAPVDSLHYEVFADALQDLRALQALENKISREAVLSLLDEGLETPLTIHDYPSDPQWLMDLRRRISEKLN